MSTTFVRRRIRVGLLGFWHEANSFAANLADASYVRAAEVSRGRDVLERYQGSASTVGGFIAAAESDRAVDLVPLTMATLVPTGRLTAGVLRDVVEDFRHMLQVNGPFDAVLVALHGAAVSVDIEDVDGLLLEEIRRGVGPDVVVGTSLDLHANISRRMCEAIDVLNTYRTNPHVDAQEMAVEVASLVFAAARGEISPVVAHINIPAIINILAQNTSTQPMVSILEKADRLAGLPGILGVSVAQGYPYADVPEMGMSVVVVADGRRPLARDTAVELAQVVWEQRESFQRTALDIDAALDQAANSVSGPVLLLDVGDNIGAGAPGDSVALLQAAVRRDIQDMVIIVNDPVAADACHIAGLGAEVDLIIGGESTALELSRIETRGTVLSLSDGKFRTTETLHAGFREFDTGPTSAVRLSTRQTVVLTSRAVLPLTPLQLANVGLSTCEFRAIVAKGVHSPLAGYGPSVAVAVAVDTPGVTNADCLRLPYVKRRRPLFPFETFEWLASAPNEEESDVWDTSELP